MSLQGSWGHSIAVPYAESVYGTLARIFWHILMQVSNNTLM